MTKITTALQRPTENIDVLSLRGQLLDIHQLEKRFSKIKAGDYVLMILDALYRTLPEGTSENDNAAMAAVFNRLDYYASRLNCAIVVIHHASKGEQADKGVTDVGSGAGSISRAADTHLIIRPHEQPNHAVMEAVCRSFKSPEPITIQFEWPVWYATTLEPAIKRRKSLNELGQVKRDAEADAEVVGLLRQQSNPVTERWLRDHATFGTERVKRAIARLMQAGTLGNGSRKKGQSGSQKVCFGSRKKGHLRPVLDAI